MGWLRVEEAGLGCAALEVVVRLEGEREEGGRDFTVARVSLFLLCVSLHARFSCTDRSPLGKNFRE